LKSIITKLPRGNSLLAGIERDELQVYYEYAEVTVLVGKGDIRLSFHTFDEDKGTLSCLQA
jgi:hypothetical protein